MLGPPPSGPDAAPEPAPEPEPEWPDEPADLAAAEPTPDEGPDAVPDAPPQWSEASWDEPEDELEDELEVQAEPVHSSPEPSDPQAEPGFALLHDSLHERLASLLSPQVPLTLTPPPPTTSPAPVPDDQGALEQPAEAEPWPEQAAGLAWPFGTGWDELAAGHNEAIESAPEIAQNDAPPAGLLGRLRAWIRRGR